MPEGFSFDTVAPLTDAEVSQRGLDFKGRIDAYADRLVAAAMEQAGNKQDAAKLLGIPLRTLTYRQTGK